MDLDKAITNRHSVRHFKDKKPDWRDVLECIDAARYAPMAGNIYSLKFIIVQDQEKIQKLAEAAQQSFIAEAQCVVVICSDPKKTVGSYDERGEKYLRQQAGSAIQNFLLKIEEKKLATCWIGAFVDYLVKEALNIPEEIYVEAFFPIGYELGKCPVKRKCELDRILFFDEYDNRKMKPVKIVKD